MSENESAVLLQAMDRELKKFPEVVSVFGKEGRSESATIPAAARHGGGHRRVEARAEWRKGLTWDALVKEWTDKLHCPGCPRVVDAIQTRTEMLATGVRSPSASKCSVTISTPSRRRHRGRNTSALRDVLIEPNHLIEVLYIKNFNRNFDASLLVRRYGTRAHRDTRSSCLR